jgi:rare lipoprotein A
MNSAPTQFRRSAARWLMVGFFLLSCCAAPRYTHVSSGDSDGSSAAASTFQDSPVTDADQSLQVANATGDFYQTGEASYYANKFHGRKTASGQRYDRTKFTAAHRTLPYGTMVKVTNLKNNLTVTVRINDRGPQKRSRIIDISAAAAKEIKMISDGIIRVGIEIVENK